ncbi:MAG: MFS transporter [Acidimicrobiia bacterium]|nr:MFS transporter [Acidimicrobiia bacterium]
MSSSRSPEVTAALAARFLLGVSFGSILAVGLTDGALGVAWPTMRDEFGRSLDDLGIVLGAFFVGFGPATALHRKLLPRFGMGRLVLAGPSLAVVGLLIVASAPGWLAVLAGYALVGLGNGLSDPSINLYLALHHGVRPMGLLHASFGLGTTLSPLIMTAALPVSWRLGYVVLIGVELVVVAAMVRARPRWLPVEGDGGRVSFPSSAVTWITLTIFMLYTGSELAAGQWAFSLLTESRDIGDTAAGFVVSVYWGGLTVGRLVYGTVGDRFPPRSMLSGAFIVAATGMAMVWVADSLVASVLGFVVAGLGMAGIFPLLVLLTPQRIGRDVAGEIMGLQFTAAALGGVSVPWIVGIIAERSSLEVVPGLLVGSILLAALLNSSVARRS